jgi:hypothetical protein
MPSIVAASDFEVDLVLDVDAYISDPDDDAAAVTMVLAELDAVTTDELFEKFDD